MIGCAMPLIGLTDQRLFKMLRALFTVPKEVLIAGAATAVAEIVNNAPAIGARPIWFSPLLIGNKRRGYDLVIGPAESLPTAESRKGDAQKFSPAA